MKTYENTFPLRELSDYTQHFMKTFNPLFFDIETTGLSSARNHIYCIGCGFRENDDIRIQLFFAENAADEPKVLEAFYKRLRKFSVIVTFNGTTFDIPFILKRTEIFCAAFAKYHDFSVFASAKEQFTDYFTGKKCDPEEATKPTQNMALLKSFETKCMSKDDLCMPHRISIDLYREVHHMKNLLELPAYRQKCVEEFLGCARDDKFNGGQLIEIYEEYTIHPAPELLHLLLLHNYEDVKGMFSLVDILAYRQLADGDFVISDIIREPGNSRSFADSVMFNEFLNIKIQPEYAFPRSIHRIADDAMFALGKDSALVRFPIRHGELKHFFPDPENYYYLPDEDAAIHKSVGEFVDKAHRKKATKKNCYIRKTCDYIEIPVKTENAYLKKDCSDKHSYLEITANELPSAGAMHDFLQAYFTQFFR